MAEFNTYKLQVVEGNIIRQKIDNTIRLSCREVNFLTSSNIEIYLRQNNRFFQYQPSSVLSRTELELTIPFNDAMKLTLGEARLQIALTDEDGNSIASDLIDIEIKELLKDTGYNPV